LDTVGVGVAGLSGGLWGHSWRFDVKESSGSEGFGDEVRLEFVGIASVPSEAKIYLIDRHLDNLVDVRAQTSYCFYLNDTGVVNEGEARFMLLSGTEAYVDSNEIEFPKPPAQTLLHSSHPNPFKGSTLVRYDVGASGRMRLCIYDAQGSLVRVLLDGTVSPGRYEVVWCGENEGGRRVGAGIYFCHLESTSGFEQTQKILMIK
jgi:hypothetical protein